MGVWINNEMSNQNNYKEVTEGRDHHMIHAGLYCVIPISNDAMHPWIGQHIL